MKRKSLIRIVNNSSFRFKREEHLKGRKEIREVFGKGRRYEFRGVKLFVLRNNLPYNRICFTFSKSKIWNAVSRNRARRLGREAFRLMKDRVIGGNDLILLVYPVHSVDKLPGKTAGGTLPSQLKQCAESGKIRNESLSDRIAQLESLFKKAGLMK